MTKVTDKIGCECNFDQACKNAHTDMSAIGDFDSIWFYNIDYDENKPLPDPDLTLPYPPTHWYPHWTT